MPAAGSQASGRRPAAKRVQHHGTCQEDDAVPAVEHRFERRHVVLHQRQRRPDEIRPRRSEQQLPQAVTILPDETGHLRHRPSVPRAVCNQHARGRRQQRDGPRPQSGAARHDLERHSERRQVHQELRHLARVHDAEHQRQPQRGPEEEPELATLFGPQKRTR